MGHQPYTYDNVGNRLSSLGLSPWTFDVSNQLLSTPLRTYTYDNNGNTITKVNARGTTTYTWDYENRLTSVVLPNGGGVVTFKYDPFGRRIQKSGPGGVTGYLYDGANAVADVDSGGAFIARYVQGAGIDEPLSSITATGTSFFEADGLGSITSLSGVGGLTDTYVYKPFGSTTATGMSTNRFRYTGREWDQETGLYYYRARYYDPQLGRFLSEDPIRFSSGDTNFFAYVSNGSPNLVDPSGLVEGSPANSGRRKAIADIARGYVGSHDYDVNANKGSQYPANSWKCSKFVCDVIAEAGAPIHVTVNGKLRCPTAGELANPKWIPKNWRRLEPGETVLPGDIAAYRLTYDPNESMPSTGHSGIVELDGVMAAHQSGIYIVPNQLQGQNVEHLRYIGE